MMHRAHICHIFLPIYSVSVEGFVFRCSHRTPILFILPVEALVQAIKTQEVKNSIISTFGSYTWAPQVVKQYQYAA